MNCAIIGYGYWGKIIEKYLLNDSFFTLSYICTKNSERKVEDIVSDPNIEAVFICTPINTHYEIVQKALRQKKHVFCEKPLCKTKREIEALANLSCENKVILFTDYTFLFSPSYIQIKREIDKFEKIFIIKAEIAQFGTFYKEDDVFDVLGVHLFSLIINLFPSLFIEKLQIQDISVVHDKQTNLALTGTIILKYQDIYIELYQSLVSTKRRRTFEIFREQSILSFDLMQKQNYIKLIINKEETGYSITNKEECSNDENNNLRTSIDEFRNCILTGINNNLILSIKITQLLEIIKKSIY